jgi:hypothetical protein
MFNTVSVRFVNQNRSNDKEYAYLTDLDLKEGDIVVVDTQYGFKTAEVTSLFCNENDANKWVVCKVDAEAFGKKLATLKHKQFILKQMKTRLDQVDVMDRFALAAKSDEVMAKLLKSFNTEIKELAE